MQAAPLWVNPDLALLRPMLWRLELDWWNVDRAHLQAKEQRRVWFSLSLVLDYRGDDRLDPKPPAQHPKLSLVLTPTTPALLSIS